MRIAVLTSGGDAPGMNAAVRTVAVVGHARGHEVLGVRFGYAGLLAGDVVALGLEAVEGISRMGGTMLGSARCPEFGTDEAQARAVAQVQRLGIDGLVVIGGDGSLTGALRFARNGACQVVGLPASIDNDIGHCGLSIGVDTAVNTIVEACDRISDTARAHRRAFVVEVMGRRCGFLAMRAGIAADADAILFPEDTELVGDADAVVAKLQRVLGRCFRPEGYKRRALILVAEGIGVATPDLVARLQGWLDEHVPGVGIRATILGHVVRGGNPTVMDRTIAQRLAFAAVRCLEAGVSAVMPSWRATPGVGMETEDPNVRVVPIPEVLAETARLLDGSSELIQRRVALLRQVEDILAL